MKALGAAHKGPGIRFLCESDAIDDPGHKGFWTTLGIWNKWRHETFKDNRDGFEDDTETVKVRTNLGWSARPPSARLAATERCVELACRITALPSASPSSFAFAHSIGRRAANR